MKDDNISSPIKEGSTKGNMKPRDSKKSRTAPPPGSDSTDSELDINDLIEKNKEIEDKYIRLYAEFENHKRRFREQLTDVKIQTKYSTVKELLNIIDDIMLSKKSMESGTDEGSWVEGAMLIFNKLESYIKSVGIEEVGCEKGDEFNADNHDCVTVIDMGNDNINKIIDVIKMGYKIDGKIVKYPQVIVGK